MKKKTAKTSKATKAVKETIKGLKKIGLIDKKPANTIYNTIHFVIWTGPDNAETFIDLHASVKDAIDYARSLIESGDKVLAITPNFNWKEGDGLDLL